MVPKRITQLGFFVGAALSSWAFADPPRPATPTITLQSSSVTISGLTHGGMVTMCSEAREQAGYEKRFIHRDALVTDKSGAGVVSLPVNGVSDNSIWFAVDNATGAYSMAMPSASPYVPLQLPSNALRRNGKGDLFKVDMPLAIFDLLLVRPGEGSWTGTIGDGGPLDDDPHPNGRAAAEIGKLKPLGKSGSTPDKLRKGDVLIGIDHMSLRYFVVVVGEQ
ncbi:MAG TPA: hypothetical protein VJZ76_07120 [Thermoanaerobaculia bacterium]|nr:hypothetical protein [Thermoanaerobaculia bacterium]